MLLQIVGSAQVLRADARGDAFKRADMVFPLGVEILDDLRELAIQVA
jgi:hypothetical protein